MQSRKPYATPQLIVHGDVATITQQGGINVTDVPIGTPTSPPGVVTSVAS